MTTTPRPRQATPDPLHGVTLEQIVNALVAFFGWRELGERIPIGCFSRDPSVASSLKFLRRTPWARAKVEGLYLYMLREQARRARRERRRPDETATAADVPDEPAVADVAEMPDDGRVD